MKIICFIVVLIAIMKEIHSLKCLITIDDKDTDSKECEPGGACGYVIDNRKPNKPYRDCMTKDMQGSLWTMGKCKTISKSRMQCACDTDNCNYNCSVGTCPIKDTVERQMGEPEECNAICKAAVPETTPTDALTTNKTKTNSIDDNARATSEDGPQPTDDSTAVTGEDGSQSAEDGIRSTGEDGPQPTEDRSGATAEDAEETQKPTGKASNNSGNLRVVLTVVLGYFY